MKKYISNLLIAIKTEHLKKKGSGIYFTSVIIGALSPILYFFVKLFAEIKIEEKLPFNFYTTFIYEVIIPFAFFFLPLLIIIHASKIAQLDHKNGGWQLMETQPLEKFSIYFSKFIVLLIANLLAILSFFIFSIFLTYLSGLFIEIPSTAIQKIEGYLLVNLFVRLFLASFLLTAFQYFLSVLISSFIWALLIGFFALISTSILKSFNLIPDWYPFEILNRIADYKEGSDLGYYLLYTEKISFLFSIIVLIVGFIWYKKKSFIRAFIKPFNKIAFSLIFVIL